MDILTPSLSKSYLQKQSRITDFNIKKEVEEDPVFWKVVLSGIDTYTNLCKLPPYEIKKIYMALKVYKGI